MKRGPSRWTRLDNAPKRSRKSKLGRLTNVSEAAPHFLTPLSKSYEKITRVEKTVDPLTNRVKKKRFHEYRYDESGEKIPKIPKEIAFGAWDIESHCYEHTCSEDHRKESGYRGEDHYEHTCSLSHRNIECDGEKEGRECPECKRCEACDVRRCPACNPEHGDHWIAGQLSTLRIPDAYIEYVANLEESQMFGGTRIDGGRYVEFLNDESTKKIKKERARCIAVGGCIDRTLRFLMSHSCFFQKARSSSGYVLRGKHSPDCDSEKNLRRDGSPCAGCKKRPFVLGSHTPSCRWERNFKKKDGSACEGCMTLSTVWYAHFGGGYDFNFALRWLSNHGVDSEAIREAIVEVHDPEEAASLREAMEKRYEYKAESVLSGATHIQVKLNKLVEVYDPPKKAKKLNIPTSTRPKPGPGTQDYWLKGFLERGLAPSGELCSIREAQETLNIVTNSRLKARGQYDKRTGEAIRDFQKKCSIPATGIVDRETSAALRYLRTQTTFKADPNEAILLRDSFRLVASKLEDIAKDFKLTYPDGVTPLRKLEDIDVRNPPPPDDPEYRKYCRVDTEICVQLVTTFSKLITQELRGSLEMTASSCAMALFRRHYLKDPVYRQRHFSGCRLLCKTCNLETCSRECGTKLGKKAGENLDKHQKILSEYKKELHKLCPTYPAGCFHFTALGKNGHRHGGHVDVLQQRLENGRCYDVNSLYPFAMLGPVPVGSMQRYIAFTPDEKKRIKKGPRWSAAGAWERQMERTRQEVSTTPYWSKFVDEHGVEFATLERLYRMGADRGSGLQGERFDDPEFDKVDSFKRIRMCGFVEAIVSIPQNDRIPECYFPPLPVVREPQGDGEILFWPVGNGIYSWWCYEELRTLLEVPGAKLIAVRQSVWFQGEPIFKEFIETLYERRMKSDGAMKQLLKILMNSTYGKTLQNPLKRRVLRLQVTQKRPAGWLPTNPMPEKGDDFSWPWGTVQSYQEAPFFLPQWGSLITARARVAIWKICVDVERGKYGKGNKVAYMDTDSCYTTAKLPEDDKELGQLKLEYKLTEKKRIETLAEFDKILVEYEALYESNIAAAQSIEDLGERKERLRRLEARRRYFRKKIQDERGSPKYARARPEGLITCEFHGPKLYIVMDPTTGADIKAVHKGAPDPTAEKLRRFIRGESLETGRPKKKAPKAGVGIRDDFRFNPIALTRTGKKILWKKPAQGESEVHHKRIHHYRTDGRGITSPRFIDARDEFELEESFRVRRRVSATSLYREWTGKAWPEEPAQSLKDVG